MTDALPILDYADLFGQTLLFLAVVAAVVVGIRTLSHALTRENAAHLLRQRAQRRRKEDQWRCWVCDMPTDCTHGVTNIITQYAHGTDRRVRRRRAAHHLREEGEVRPRIGFATAALMAGIGALGGQAVAAPTAAPSAQTQSKDQMPGEARQRVVANMVLKKKKARRSGGPRGDGFDDFRRERAMMKRARKLARVGGWYK